MKLSETFRDFEWVVEIYRILLWSVEDGISFELGRVILNVKFYFEIVAAVFSK